MWTHFVPCLVQHCLPALRLARQTRCWMKMFDHLAGASLMLA